MIKVHYDDFTVTTYDTIEDAEVDLLENLAAGVMPDYIYKAENEDIKYYAQWSVKLLKL